MKTCFKCKKEKLVAEFNFNKAKGDGRNHICRQCINEFKASERVAKAETLSQYHKKWRKNNKELKKQRTRDWVKANPDKLLSSRLKYYYGITLEFYNELLAAQQNKCAVCDSQPTKKKRLCVDHCHKTGQVRGLLCDRCNRSIGLMKDDVTVLRKAVDYLCREGTSTSANTLCVRVDKGKTDTI
jgi:hypothetical protein